jgi:hypothetical protein
MTYYAEDGLNRVLEAKARPPVPQVPGFVHVADAAEQLGFAFTQTVGKNRRKQNGRFKTVHGRSKDGRALPRYYVRQKFLNRELKAKDATIPPDRMTVDEIAEKLHIKPQSVHNYLRDGRLPYIVKDGPTKKDGFRRPIALVDRRAAKKLIAERNGEVIEPGARMKHGPVKAAAHSIDPHGILPVVLRAVQPGFAMIGDKIDGGFAATGEKIDGLSQLASKTATTEDRPPEELLADLKPDGRLILTFLWTNPTTTIDAIDRHSGKQHSRQPASTQKAVQRLINRIDYLGWSDRVLVAVNGTYVTLRRQDK